MRRVTNHAVPPDERTLATYYRVDSVRLGLMLDLTSRLLGGRARERDAEGEKKHKPCCKASGAAA